MKIRSVFPAVGKRKIWILFWILTALMLNGLVTSLVNAIRGMKASSMTSLGLIAFIFGWLLASQSQHPRLRFFGGILFGCMILFVIYSGSIGPILSGIAKSLPLVRLNGPVFFNPTQAQAIFDQAAQIINQMQNFAGEITSWIQTITQQNAPLNPHTREFVWVLPFWVSLFSTAWMLRKKRHALIACLPVLVLMAGVLGLTRQKTMGMIITTGAVLSLIVLLEHLKREAYWEQNKIDYSEELTFDIFAIAGPIIAMIILVSAVIPNISIEDLRDFYEDLFIIESRSENLPESLGLDQNPDAEKTTRQSAMPQSHLIDAGPELSYETVMQVWPNELQIESEINRFPQLPKYYWFSRSYDIYTGIGWQTSEITYNRIPAGSRITTPDPSYFIVETFTFSKAANTSNQLYSPGLPYDIDQIVTVGWREKTSEYFAAQLEAKTYTVAASILNVNNEKLQEANEIPPDLIIQNYTDLPENLPLRVIELAESLTKEANTPYEKAERIEAFLRTFEYTLDIPTPPSDRDIVDYFLFDLQKGYCDYYASAMVILARAVNLPARLVTGYATGQADPVQGFYNVTAADAHSWAEIYIAPFGWVPFEPTASRPVFSRSEIPLLPSEFLPTPTPTEDAMPSGEIKFLILGLGLIISLASLIIISLIVLKNQRAKRKAPHLQLEYLYQRLTENLSQRFIEKQGHTTPSEYKDQIIAFLQHHRPQHNLDKKIQDFKQTLSSFILLYHHAIYASKVLTTRELSQAWKKWRKIQRNAFLIQILFIFQKS